MIRRMLFCATLWALATLPAAAQDADLPLHDDAYQLLDRLDVQGALPEALPSELKPYARERVVRLLRNVDSTRLEAKDLAWLDRVRFRLDDDYAAIRTQAGSAWYERGFWGNFYRNRRDLVAVRDSGFRLYANPVFHWGVGRELLSGSNTADEDVVLYRNTNGLTVRGGLGDKLGFYAEVLATQQRLPSFGQAYVRQSDVVPGEAYWKSFKSDGVDYFTWRGYLTYTPSDFLRIKFGQDQAFWGQGTQSLWLSDFAPSYLLLQLNWRIWKLEYTNLFTQMVDYIRRKPDSYGTYPRKFGAFHMLTYRPNQRFSVSLWEGTLFAAQQPGGDRGFELSYLNPLIFYRAAEQYLGSPDNSALGAMAKANLWQTLQLYGQFVLDDYNFGNRRNGSGWRGNKYGFQLGARYLDVLNVETLDLQLELNQIRPYTYGHYNLATNWSHYGHPLAHTFGTNLRDVAIALSFQPVPALYLHARFNRIEQGLNEPGRNWGGDIFAPEANFVRDYGNTVLQGRPYELNIYHGRISYQLWRSLLYFDVEGQYRDFDDGRSSLSVFGGLRYSIPWRPQQWLNI